MRCVNEEKTSGRTRQRRILRDCYQETFVTRHSNPAISRPTKTGYASRLHGPLSVSQTTSMLRSSLLLLSQSEHQSPQLLSGECYCSTSTAAALWGEAVAGACSAPPAVAAGGSPDRVKPPTAAWLSSSCSPRSLSASALVLSRGMGAGCWPTTPRRTAATTSRGSLSALPTATLLMRRDAASSTAIGTARGPMTARSCSAIGCTCAQPRLARSGFVGRP